jgi:hypothetical protein
MQTVGRLGWVLSFLMFALLPYGCGGRAINKKSARDAIIDSPGAELAKNDIEVLSITAVGAHDAVVETRLHVAFQLERVGKEWVVRAVRVGEGQWEKISDILEALQRIKTEETKQRLDKVAAAIEAYRQKNGSLPDFSDYVSLSDALFPLYLNPLIREDAWGNPMIAIRLGTGAVRLLSDGPDGKEGTADDIEVTRSYPPVAADRVLRVNFLAVRAFAI